ncbi:MAG: hypothetical protein K0R41_2006 [Geminicoccaceae bacterium]|jgi:hypothetical protein|nr:hypothetical protein [Geminicoccaceae bacterium]
MTMLARGLRVGTMVVGMAVLTSACAQTGAEDSASLDQAQAAAASAEAAADRATQAADRAAAAAAEAADAASNAQMAMERQDRMTQQSLRK